MMSTACLIRFLGEIRIFGRNVRSGFLRPDIWALRLTLWNDQMEEEKNETDSTPRIWLSQLSKLPVKSINRMWSNFSIKNQIPQC